ncbi:MAG: NADH:ubiquinone oxidoreductase [Pseudomonadaceae bacterium]|nr:MAG: NADH:ubiquinone oxidoreductase [Pseudomonadaceae bacterium]
MRPIRFFYALVLLLLLPASQVFAAACLIESDDDDLPIRLCQQNMTIPENLFQDSFCQPQIPDRSFKVTEVESCPEGAYGVCAGAHTEGVGYQQSIFYYSDPDDAPYLKVYCEEVSRGEWQVPAQ